MRKRRFIIFGILVLVVFLSVIATLWFPPAKRITVPMSYSTVTNKIAQWRPVRVSWRGFPSDVRAEEKSPDALYIRSIFERGDPKFGPYTVVSVSKLDETQTTVELSTMQYALFGIFGRRHVFFIERRRWKEMQRIIHQ